MEYNTQREELQFREYGRNVQRIVKYICDLPDGEEKKQMVEILVKMMGHVSGAGKKDEVAQRKLWDHLMLISLFSLEKYWPYSPGDLQALKMRAMNSENTASAELGYKNVNIEHRHFGEHLEAMLRKLKDVPDGPEYNELLKLLAQQSKRTYMIWNGDTPDDRLVVEQMFEVSKDPRVRQVMDGPGIHINQNSLPAEMTKQKKKKDKKKNKMV
ncbi:MAG: DUF4290 domain-containing protein [Bacteroidales bacterium]|nr:DUF4290 domain-containing protein [Bacteroidales bacterium]